MGSEMVKERLRFARVCFQNFKTSEIITLIRAGLIAIGAVMPRAGAIVHAQRIFAAVGLLAGDGVGAGTLLLTELRCVASFRAGAHTFIIRQCARGGESAV